MLEGLQQVSCALWWPGEQHSLTKQWAGQDKDTSPQLLSSIALGYFRCGRMGLRSQAMQVSWKLWAATMDAAWPWLERAYTSNHLTPSRSNLHRYYSCKRCHPFSKHAIASAKHPCHKSHNLASRTEPCKQHEMLKRQLSALTYGAVSSLHLSNIDAHSRTVGFVTRSMTTCIAMEHLKGCVNMGLLPLGPARALCILCQKRVWSLFVYILLPLCTPRFCNFSILSRRPASMMFRPMRQC